MLKYILNFGAIAPVAASVGVVAVVATDDAPTANPFQELHITRVASTSAVLSDVAWPSSAISNLIKVPEVIRSTISLW